ncbi:MAG TPA: TraB/GumN family protein [Acidobacteriota bacterium]|nr:TraB/GumN family protein [Acidobacteriota bacterium]
MSEQEQLPGMVETGELPPSVHVIEHLGRQIFLVGTAHVSKESVVDVRRTIESVKPDVVCVELDEVRYNNLTDPTRWRKTNIGEVIRKGKAMLLLSSLIMTSFQRRIGKKLGVMPGAELLEGVKAAEDVGARVVLADRDIQVTLKRTWRNLGMWDKFKMVTQLTASLFVTEEIDEATIEELKDTEKLSDVLQLLSDEFPKMKSTLIDERDRYLAQKIGEVEADRIVAVVGAGHVPGILKEIEVDQDLAALEVVPPPSKRSGVLKWAIPGLILALFAYGFLKGGSDESVTSIYIWFLINGSLAAIGAALALGHPLTVISAFLAAPLTSLNPMIAAGWVSGLVQALVKKPTVKDLEELPEAITSVKGFWLNPVSRILLVVVFSNLGSVIGTFVAGSWIAARLIG